MAKKENRQEDGPDGPGEWIVTFSDCMTLLLCFFVLLLTFSSFDEVELQKLAGAFKCETNDSIFPNSRMTKDSVVPPRPREADRTEKGSEMPTVSDNTMTRHPAVPEMVFNDDAHKDRKVFYLPSDWLFLGRGQVLTAEGRNYLSAIAGFMQRVPTRVVIGEVGPGADGADRAVYLDRPLTVMQFFARASALPEGLFNITLTPPAPPSRMRDRRVLAVMLIPTKVY